MEIITLTTKYMESHCYLVAEQGHCVLIDPGDAEIVLSALQSKRLKVDFGFVTHEHCDHIFGCTELQTRKGIPFYASDVCNHNMQSEQKNFSRYYEAFISVQTKVLPDKQKMMSSFTARADRTFSGETSIDWRGHRFYLRETPGHSQGSICIILDDEHMFSGDTLLANDLTGLRFVGSSQKKLLDTTLPWIRHLSPNLTVWPGHGPAFILGERLLNPIY